jgi:hypothetical protein
MTPEQIPVESCFKQVVYVSACPCCEGVELYAGYADADTVQVRCRGCGLEMNVNTEEGWNEAVRKTEKSDSAGRNALALAAQLSLDIAVARWNRRPARRKQDAGM